MESARATTAPGTETPGDPFAPSLAPVAPAAHEPQMAPPAAAAAEFLSQGPDGQRQILLRLLRAGESDATIGARFRLSQWQVRNLRYRLGIRKDRGGNVHLATRGRGAEAVPAAVALQLSGSFEAGDLARRLLAMGAMFEAAPGNYRVRLQIDQPGAGM